MSCSSISKGNDKKEKQVKSSPISGLAASLCLWGLCVFLALYHTQTQPIDNWPVEYVNHDTLDQNLTACLT